MPRPRQAGGVLCPGVGFEVVPTDCLAVALEMALPDATHLALIETYIPASPTLLCWRWWLPWLQPLFVG